MTSLEALVALNMTQEIASTRLANLIEHFGSPENILKASRERLLKVPGLGEKIAAAIASLKADDLSRELESAKELGLNILTPESAGYPDNLKDIPARPIVLYVKGQIKAQDNLAVGIVGSRRASFYGLTQSEKFSAGLTEKGFTVVSGMARGIDTAAHRAALKAGGRTIAVIGSGFNHLYPEENKGLAEEISQSGAVVSEFPLDAKPLPLNFPRRNRLISGLSLGVLVVEAARNSGALITADFALEQNREVFAIPGRIDSMSSFGTNNLIKQGAKLVTCVEEIAEEFSFPEQALKGRKADAGEVPEQACEEKVYQLIGPDAVQLDELVEMTGFDIPDISDMLFKLLAKKKIRQLPGKYFTRYS
jgi:DNA processing protein